MRGQMFMIFSLTMAVAACTDAASSSDDKTEEAMSDLRPDVAGTWVQGSGTFGPCLTLPATCQVGDTIAAHSGPGNAGGCYNYTCKLRGTWVQGANTFGPCNTLPAICYVGDTTSAHSGPGNAGGCYIYQCE